MNLSLTATLVVVVLSLGMFGFANWRARQPAQPLKVRNSLRSLKRRDKDCRVVRRKGRVYVINKKNPRFKARQG